MLGVLPADERLGAADAAIAQIDDRLVVHDDLAGARARGGSR